MIYLFYIAIILILGVLAFNFIKITIKRRQIIKKVNPISSPKVEILYSMENKNNKIRFVSGSLSELINESDCIYLPTEVNKRLEIRTFYEELDNFINDKIEKEVLYYYNTSMKNKIFLSEQQNKKIVYSIIPFSYELSEIEDLVKENYSDIIRKCTEIKCKTILIPIKFTDRIGIQPAIYASYVIKPILLSSKIVKDVGIYLFYENERLLWNIINLLK